MIFVLSKKKKKKKLKQVPRGSQITPGLHHLLIIKYFKVNDNDIRQDIVYNVSLLSDTDLSSQIQLSWSCKISGL